LETFLKIVGKGKRGARDLTLEEAREAARLIVRGEAKPAQIGAFLVAERIKTESADELVAFAEALREASVRFADPTSHALRIDCAGPYNGRRRTFCATWPAAFVLAASGMAVTLHGVREIGPKRGITLHAMLLTRGIDMDRIPIRRLASALRQLGVGYAPAERMCPPLADLHDIREQLGLRTVLNTAEKLVDYGDSPCLAMGIFHRTVAERYGEAAIRLGYRRTAIVQGMEGSEDLFVDRPTTVWIAEGDDVGRPEEKASQADRPDKEPVVRRVIDPEAFGLKRDVPDVEWTAASQIETAEAVLDGSAPAAFIDMTVLNAAFRMHLSGRVESLEEGVALSRELLASGEPRQRYGEWLSLLRRTE
jgi:anthranilate phosphoribosyltransferase